MGLRTLEYKIIKGRVVGSRNDKLMVLSLDNDNIILTLSDNLDDLKEAFLDTLLWEVKVNHVLDQRAQAEAWWANARKFVSSCGL